MNNAEITPLVCHVSLLLSASVSVGCIAESKVKERICNYGRYCPIVLHGVAPICPLIRRVEAPVSPIALPAACYKTFGILPDR